MESRYFLAMVMVLILNFSLSIYILDQTQQNLFAWGVEPIFKEDQYMAGYQELTQDKTKNELFDSFFTQYLLMLGEFEILSNPGKETYPQISQNLIWLYFLGATFMTQIVFFNVLVAVIGEAYSEKWARKDLYALQQRTSIFGDYIKNLKTTLPNDKFLYVIRPQVIQNNVELQLEEYSRKVESSND